MSASGNWSFQVTKKIRNSQVYIYIVNNSLLLIDPLSDLSEGKVFTIGGGRRIARGLGQSSFNSQNVTRENVGSL